MLWKIRHLIYALVVLCGMAGAASRPGGLQRATDAMADLLAASFLAEHCRIYVQRLDGRTHHALIADGLIILINENDVTMTDFMQMKSLYSVQTMLTFRNQTLKRYGVNPEDKQSMCFVARSLAGSTRGPGRFLERH